MKKLILTVLCAIVLVPTVSSADDKGKDLLISYQMRCKNGAIKIGYFVMEIAKPVTKAEIPQFIEIIKNGDKECENGQPVILNMIRLPI